MAATIASRANRQPHERLARQGGLADAEETVRLAPGYSFAHRARAHVLEDLGRYAAIPDDTEATRLDPAERFALKQRGLAYTSLGVTAKARVGSGSFLALQPGDEDGTAAVGMLKR